MEQYVHKCNNRKAMLNVNTINGCAGDVNISQMWEKHYENLYNSVDVVADKNTFLQRLSQSNKGSDRYVINLRDISWCCSVQKKGKAPGADGLAVEAIMYGGSRLHTHLAVLCNCFIKCGYLPKPFMHSLIIPLVKSKSAVLTDVNNYRSIAVSTAMSKLFESVTADEITTASPADKYQPIWV